MSVSGPSIDAWLATREPAPPERLASALRSIVRDAPAELAPADVLLHEAARLLRRLVQEGETTRDSALDLLVADALVTYAFEAASDEPDQLEGRCLRAMRTISDVVDSA